MIDKAEADKLMWLMRQQFRFLSLSPHPTPALCVFLSFPSRIKTLGTRISIRVHLLQTVIKINSACMPLWVWLPTQYNSSEILVQQFFPFYNRVVFFCMDIPQFCLSTYQMMNNRVDFCLLWIEPLQTFKYMFSWRFMFLFLLAKYIVVDLLSHIVRYLILYNVT